MFLLVEDRTEHFTEKFVQELDGRNLTRMHSLPPWVQQHIVYTYGPKDGKEIYSPDKYFGGVIGGIRRLAQSGLTEDESMRMIELSKTGTRLSYHACRHFGQNGTCKFGWTCRHPHIFGIWE